MSGLSEEKVMRDPIHGYVRIDQKIIWDCLNAPEFQRLRRIRQLGSTQMVYHTGEHSRFSHSLGVYEIARRMTSEVEDVRRSLSEHEKIVLQLAALLHDVGHAPFSHSFESIMEASHEDYTKQILLGPGTIHDILAAESAELPQEVASVIDHSHPRQMLCQLISSQLDADRMDYLLRDSYFTGTSYGQFDLERILRTMRVAGGRVVIKSSGMHTVEDYIMARYHMYWQVYYHPVSRSYDCLLKQVFHRLKDLYRQDPQIVGRYPMYEALLTKRRLDNADYFRLDDAACQYSFQLMRQDRDPILADLAARALDRGLFEYGKVSEAEHYRRLAAEKGYDPDYYVTCDRQQQNPYQPYRRETKAENAIWMLMEDGSIKELSEVSPIVEALAANPDQQDERVFFPPEIGS
jgi:HD superfamily phosphohydrolase